MPRSRSSFDLSGAIATAASLSVVVPEDQPAALYRGVPLVSFGPTAGPPTQLPPGTPTEPSRHPEPLHGGASGSAKPRPITEPFPEGPKPRASAGPFAEPPPPEPPPPPAEVDPSLAEAARRPPRLPDLSAIKSPAMRCQKMIAWIVEAVGASEVFIADAAGLPIAGSIVDAEARLAATGVVASSVAHLAASIPGNSSGLFELHVGEGPFFQLIGFEVAQASYVVGLQRPTPLGFRQAHAVRLACRHALGAGANGAAESGSGEA